MQLLLPPDTDIRDGGPGHATPDLVEAPLGTGRFYNVWYVDDIARGFPNQHRFALIRKVTDWPAPIP